MRLIGLFLIGIGLAAVGWPACSSDPAAPTLPGRPATTYTPATTCAAAGCHGGQEVGRPGSEYAPWATGDPHARAYQVLSSDLSTRIGRALGLGRPQQARACLACHAVDADKVYAGELLPGRAHAEGVACNACHRPSGAWLTAHYRPGWKAQSARAKADRYGFAPTKNLAARITACAGCHVGEPGREVTHDLIAAGHPRLAFEYTRYHYSPAYAKHWTEPVPNPAFELRAWAIGQVVSLRAAVRLLADRARRADKHPATTPWPELAEWSCYACHQGLTPGPRRGGRSPGLPGWQPWYAALPGLLPGGDGPGHPAPTLPALRAAMWRINPDPSQVASLAERTAAELDAWLARLDSSPPADSARLGAAITAGALTPDGASLRDADWDVLAQHALGLTAAYHAAGGADSPVSDWKTALVALRASLAFPRGPDRYDSPKGYDPAAAAQALKALHALTHPTREDR